MAVFRTDDTGLQLALHGAAVADTGAQEPGSGWDGALMALAERLRADSVVLVLSGPAAEGLHRVGGPRPAVLRAPPDLPWTSLRALRFERVYAGAELDGPQRAALGAAEGTALRLMQVALAGGRGVAMLVAARQGGTFRAADSACLSALAPHLAQAGASWLQLRHERRRAALGEVLCRRLGAGWIMLDAQARVLDHDAQAARILGAHPRLEPPRIGERLALAHATSGQALAQVVRGAKLPRLFRLDDAPPLDLVLSEPPGWSVHSAAALGTLRAVPRDTDLPVLLAQAMGISPSEARLALALARGLSLAQAAAALGLTVETARSYTRRIYARTGLGGQGPLVAAVLGSVVWTAGLTAPGQPPDQK